MKITFATALALLALAFESHSRALPAPGNASGLRQFYPHRQFPFNIHQVPSSLHKRASPDQESTPPSTSPNNPPPSTNPPSSPSSPSNPTTQPPVNTERQLVPDHAPNPPQHETPLRVVLANGQPPQQHFNLPQDLRHDISTRLEALPRCGRDAEQEQKYRDLNMRSAAFYMALAMQKRKDEAKAKGRGVGKRWIQGPELAIEDANGRCWEPN